MQGEAEADGRSGGSPKRDSHTSVAVLFLPERAEIRTRSIFLFIFVI